MKKDKEIAIHRPTRLSVAILFLLSSILVSCASGPFGKMELDNSVRSSLNKESCSRNTNIITPESPADLMQLLL
jgi:hypothetical protein